MSAKSYRVFRLLRIYSFGLLCIVQLCGCVSSPESIKPSLSRGLEAQRSKLQSVKKGMTESEVEALCGKPEEVRKFTGEGLHDESHRWAYGVTKPGSYTKVGVVVFNKERKVIHASCPSRLLARSNHLGLESEADGSANNMKCFVESVWTNESVTTSCLRQIARISLINRSYEPWVFWGRGGIYDNLLLEVYDSRMNLLFSIDQGSSSTAMHDGMPARTLRLEHNDGICQEIAVWLSELDYGKPDPGVYYLRVAFPFSKEKPSASNLYRFLVK